jgi:hypothetical protein
MSPESPPKQEKFKRRVFYKSRTGIILLLVGVLIAARQTNASGIFGSKRESFVRNLISKVLKRSDAEARNLAKMNSDAEVYDRYLLETIIAWRDSKRSSRDFSAAANLLLNVEDIDRQLRKTLPIEIARMALADRVNGFGDYQELVGSTNRASAGQRLEVYSELKNQTALYDGEKLHKTEISSRIELIDQRGLGVFSDRSRRLDASRNVRKDFYISHAITIPLDLRPAEYKLVLHLTDELALPRQTATRSIPLTVGGSHGQYLVRRETNKADSDYGEDDH